MGTSYRTQVGPACREDGVGVVCLTDRADSDRGNAGFLANAVCKRRLEHPAVDWLFLFADFVYKNWVGRDWG